MAETVLAAVKVGPGQTELQEFIMPDIPDDSGLMRVEAAGVCGSDPGAYFRDHAPCIMGHENAGTITKLGKTAAKRWGLQEGDRVAIEEYLPCWHCEACLAGQFRLCAAGRIDYPGAFRYGYTESHTDPALWGGFSQYVYLPPNAVIHRLDSNISAELASLAVPISNGIEWACNDGNAGPGKMVLVIGPGQQGLGCVLAAKAAGADYVIIAGLARDTKRLEIAPLLGADATINVEEHDLRETVFELTDGKGVDVVVDTTEDDTGQVAKDALAVASSNRGAILMLPGTCPIDGFPFDELKRKYAVIKAYRGHSYASVERALYYIGTGRYPLGDVCTHKYGLKDVDTAINATAGIGVSGAIHVSVDPWL